MNKVQKILSKISLSTIPIMFFIVLSEFNTFMYGVGLSGVIVAVVLFFITMLFNRNFHFRNHHILALLFYLSVLFSSFFNMDENIFRTLITFTIFFIFYIFVTATPFDGENINIIIVTLIFTSLVASLFIIYNFVIDNPYGWKRYSLKVLDVYRDPNYVSALIVPSIFLFAYNFSKKNMWVKILCLFILTLGVYLTGSRAILVTIVISLAFYYFLNALKNKKTKVGVTQALFIIIASITIVLFQQISPYLFERFFTIDEYSENIRLTLWKETLPLIKARPIFGSGIESANNYLSSFNLANTHNVYLDILVGQGILGLFLFIATLVSIIFQKGVNKTFMIGFTLSMLLPLFFINGFNTTSFWLPLILTAILSNYMNDNYKLQKLIEKEKKKHEILLINN